MGKNVGSEPLGSLYSGGKVRRRREWRGFRDTLYDYSRWLRNWGVLIAFVGKPRNIKGFFRYRWMVNYLAVPMMMDRMTEGLRGPHLRIAHLEYGLIIKEIAATIEKLFRGDRRVGNDKAFSDKVVLLDENEMTAIMMGFPTLEGLSREIPTLYVANLLRQDSAEHYLDVVQTYGLAGDVCPMPATEAGISIDDDYCVLGKCAVQCNTTCDGSLLGNGVISKRLELEDGIPVFQLAAPLRHRQEDVQEYAAQEIRNAIAFVQEQAIYDMAWLTENMIMRNRTHGGYTVLLDELWEYCQEFNADMVILWEHMSCKSLVGMHGQFEEQARKLGIHLIWVSHDLCDPRNMTKQGIRDQVNRYMRTVLRETPLDPSLEILPDEKSW